MEEPNLKYIKNISEEDEAFENILLNVIKKEFLEEKEAFNIHFLNKNYKEAYFYVHKLKHKIGLLGMEGALELTTIFENQLKDEEIKHYHSFLEILDKIHVFLSKQKTE